MRSQELTLQTCLYLCGFALGDTSPGVRNIFIR
jgi:hypothetical protein